MILVKEPCYSPQIMKKSDSKQLSLATASILGQAPRIFICRGEIQVKNFRAILILFFLLGVGSVNAGDLAKEEECERAVYDIVSALGTDKANAMISSDFPAKDVLISSTTQSSGSSAFTKLKVVEVSDIKFISDETCKVSVLLTADVAIENSEQKVSGTSFSVRDEWTIHIPVGKVSEDEAPEPKSWLLGSHMGKVMLRVHVFVPEGARDELLSTDKAVEDNLKASDLDENAVIMPVQPAAGWYARLGEQMTMISEDGEFALNLEDNDKRQIEIINPAQGQVYATFAAAKLKPARDGEPETVIVELALFGECGMDDDHGSDPQWCESVSSSLTK